MGESDHSFDRYLETVPASRRDSLEAVRSLILETVPEAEESMRYKMPTYDAAGDFLAALASQKHYMSPYVNTEAMAAYRKELGRPTAVRAVSASGIRMNYRST